MSIRDLNGQVYKTDWEELVKIITEEVVKYLFDEKNTVIRSTERCSSSCFGRVKIFNPSCCSVTEISREYMLSIKSEVSSIMAL